MSRSRYLFDYDVPRWPRRLLDQDFGLTLTTDDLLSASASPIAPRYRNWWARDTNATLVPSKDDFQINVDVQHFAPEEISVKVVDGQIIVTGLHEEKQDEHGYVSRQFNRRFKLPDDCCPDSVVSKLSSDGVLTVVAPKKAALEKGERKVPITPTGPVRQEVKEQAVPTQS